MGIHARPAAIVRFKHLHWGSLGRERRRASERKEHHGAHDASCRKGSKLKIHVEGPTEAGVAMLDEMAALFDRRFEEA